MPALPRRQVAGPEPARITARRALLGGMLGFAFFGFGRTAGAQDRDYNKKVIRPPGSVEEKDFLERCIKCDQCIRVCPTNVLQPAFLQAGLEGIWTPILNNKIGYCELNCTLCGEACPTGAIHRDSFGGQVVINPDTCIGCMACFNNCPYDAIRMVEVRDENGAFMVDKEMKLIAKATKCDLCVESYGGPACERACPHGALTRINLNNIDALAKWLKL